MRLCRKPREPSSRYPPLGAGAEVEPDNPREGRAWKDAVFRSEAFVELADQLQHVPQLGLGGVDLLETSIGHGWQKGPRNSPTVLNAVFNMAQFWDGRAKDLKEQAMGPVQAAVEMNSNPTVR